MKDVSLDRDFYYPVSRFHEFRVGRLKVIGHSDYLSGVHQPFTPPVTLSAPDGLPTVSAGRSGLLDRADHHMPTHIASPMVAARFATGDGGTVGRRWRRSGLKSVNLTILDTHPNRR